jgi:chromosome segregation ATPase
MNLVTMLTRRDPLKRAFVTLEDGMTDILNEEFLLPPEPEEMSANGLGELVDLDPTAEDPAPLEPTEIVADDPAERITAHAKMRLASYNAHEEARARTTADLAQLSDALARVVAAHHMAREFASDSYADIHRANDMENANLAFAAENRRLNERVEKLEKLRGRYDQLVDVLKRREAKLNEEAETMREQLAVLKLELVEARQDIARGESVQTDLQSALSARSADAERFMREAEMLRERNIGLTVDLEMAQKKHAEARRRAEELSAMHASDSSRLAEVMARLAGEENEVTRLQKLADSLEAKLVEANDASSRLSHEMADREKRYQSENQALRAEILAQNGRLQAATTEQREQAAALADLRARFGDLESEKHVLEKKHAALLADTDGGRAAAPAGTDRNDTAALDLHRRQSEQMRGEIAELKTTIGQLRQYESLYAAARARAKAKTDVATGFSVSNGKIVPEFPSPKPLARSA